MLNRRAVAAATRGPRSAAARSRQRQHVAGDLRAWGWVITMFGAVQLLAALGIWAGKQPPSLVRGGRGRAQRHRPDVLHPGVPVLVPDDHSGRRGGAVAAMRVRQPREPGCGPAPEPGVRRRWNGLFAVPAEPRQRARYASVSRGSPLQSRGLDYGLAGRHGKGLRPGNAGRDRGSVFALVSRRRYRVRGLAGPGPADRRNEGGGLAAWTAQALSGSDQAGAGREGNWCGGSLPCTIRARTCDCFQVVVVGVGEGDEEVEDHTVGPGRDREHAVGGAGDRVGGGQREPRGTPEAGSAPLRPLVGRTRDVGHYNRCPG